MASQNKPLFFAILWVDPAGAEESGMAPPTCLMVSLGSVWVATRCLSSSGRLAGGCQVPKSSKKGQPPVHRHFSNWTR